ARRPQKLLRPDDDRAPTGIVSQTKDQDDSSLAENTNVDDQDALLTSKLASAIFGDSTLTRESGAVGYLVSLKSQANPTPTFYKYLAYMLRVSSGTSVRNSGREWAWMKQVFSDDNADFSTIENLFNVVSLATAFKEASAFAASDSALSSAATMPPLPQWTPTPSAESSSSSSSSMPASRAPSDWPRSNSISNSDSNGYGSTGDCSALRNTTSEGSSCRSKVAPGQILAMKNLFKGNIDKFGGSSCFIVDGVDTVMRLFDDAKDREEITNTMVTCKDERLPGLSLCSNVGEALEKLSEEFQIVAHDYITQVLRNYQRQLRRRQITPASWLDKDDTTQVLAVIARVLKLRKAIQVMAAIMSTWTHSTIIDETYGVKD
ncbi:hypothetical protein EC957_012264, partial [Mortierella hygrophila]